MAGWYPYQLPLVNKTKQLHGHTDRACFTVAHISAGIPAQPAKFIIGYSLIYRGPYKPPCTKATSIQNFVPIRQALRILAEIPKAEEPPFLTYMWCASPDLSRPLNLMSCNVTCHYIIPHNTTPHHTPSHSLNCPQWLRSLPQPRATRCRFMLQVLSSFLLHLFS
jgi:hypothetical protein